MKTAVVSVACCIVTFIGSSASARPYPIWDHHVGAGRFIVLADFNSDAVLDKETGLVWEKSPDNTKGAWNGALTACYDKNLGGRKGWRPPTAEELSSLVDPAKNNPSLPDKNPFASVKVDAPYWSSTTDGADATKAFAVNFNTGTVAADAKTNSYYAWCVRGDHGHNGI